MSRPDYLAVWFNGLRVALIERRSGRLRLTYTPDALGRFSPGVPLLSLRLPVQPEPFTQGVVKPFLEGLLPEGSVRRAIAERLDIKSSDTFGLLRELGRDCAGALIILPEDERPSGGSTTKLAQPLDTADLVRLIDGLRTSPLAVTEGARVSLAGVQEKLTLTHMGGGRWGLPSAGAPSTHILKPQHREFHGTVENEAFCMRLARRLGLPVADVELIEIEGRKLLAVQRFDRIIAADGTVARVHQEDICQVMGIPPSQKYEENGGPGFISIARLLSTLQGSEALDVLLRVMLFHVLAGNCDAHGKNYSLTHSSPGEVKLAPLYDLMCTALYGERRLAMYVDGLQLLERVTRERIANEARRWGMRPGAIDDALGRFFALVPEAIQGAASDVGAPPDGLVPLIEHRMSVLGGR